MPPRQGSSQAGEASGRSDACLQMSSARLALRQAVLPERGDHDEARSGPCCLPVGPLPVSPGRLQVLPQTRPVPLIDQKGDACAAEGTSGRLSLREGRNGGAVPSAWASEASCPLPGSARLASDRHRRAGRARRRGAAGRQPCRNRRLDLPAATTGARVPAAARERVKNGDAWLVTRLTAGMPPPRPAARHLRVVLTVPGRGRPAGRTRARTPPA